MDFRFKLARDLILLVIINNNSHFIYPFIISEALILYLIFSAGILKVTLQIFKYRLNILVAYITTNNYLTI